MFLIFIAHHVHIVAGAHWQIIIGSDLTGYLNVSHAGLLFARGEGTL